VTRIPHGTAGGYSNWGCRCAACRAANTESQRRFRARLRERVTAGLAVVRHGEYSTYTNWACRCDKCRCAGREQRQRYRARKDKP
jgi:hypothetical protein